MATSAATRVLVIDDSVDSAETQAAVLRIHGFDTFVCTRGDGALACIERLRPEVVLLDLSMPGVSGFAIATELRERPGLRPRLLIALTGYGDPEMRQKTHDAGFDLHLLKPVAWTELVDALRNLEPEGKQS